MIPPASPDYRVRGTLALLVLLFAIRGVALICVLPPFEMWDEYSHLAHVDHWAATGKPAVYGQTNVDPAFLRAAAKFPQPLGASFGRGYTAFWANAPAPPLPPAWGLYEAQHPFLYYAIAAPIYRATGGRSNLAAAVAVLRLVNLALGTAALALVLASLARNITAPSAVVLGCWIALQPLLLLNVVRVANDALAYFLGTAVIVTALGLRQNRLLLGATVLAVLLPLAILTKVTNAALLPVVVVLIGIAAGYRSVRWRSAICAVVCICSATAIGLAPYVIFNLHIFGLPAPMQEAVANRAAGHSLWSILTASPMTRWPVWAGSWWVVNGLWVGGWSFLWPPRIFRLLYAGLLAVAAMSMVWRWRSLALPPALRWSAASIVICVHLALMLHAVESYSAWHGLVLTNSWYAAIAIPWWLALLGSGALEIRTAWLKRTILLGAPILFLVTESYGIFVQMLPLYYASPPLSFMSMHRMAGMHPLLLGPATWLIAEFATIGLLTGLWRACRSLLPAQPDACQPDRTSENPALRSTSEPASAASQQY